MKFFNRAFDRLIVAREAQAERYVNEYLSDRGIEGMLDLSNDPRG